MSSFSRPVVRAALVVGAASALIATPAAAQTVYYGQDNLGTQSAAITQARTDFLAALTAGVGTETFEGIPDNTRAPVALNFPGAGTATLSGSGAVETSPSSGAGPVSGTHYYLVSTGGASTAFSIAFANPIAAFGFYGRDLGDNFSNLILRFTLAAGGTRDVQVPYDASRTALPNGNLLFFGFIDTASPFTRVEFRSTAAGDVFGFDDMTIGTAQQVSSVVPEPSTYGLLASGLGVLGLVARRRRTA